MRSIRAKSLALLVTIDFLFTPVSLPRGDDARSLIARRMGYDNQAPSQQAQSDEPFVADHSGAPVQAPLGRARFITDRKDAWLSQVG